MQVLAANFADVGDQTATVAARSNGSDRPVWWIAMGAVARFVSFPGWAKVENLRPFTAIGLGRLAVTNVGFAALEAMG